MTKRNFGIGIGLVMLIAGCGGGDDDDAVTGPPLGMMFRDADGGWVDDPVAVKQSGGTLYFDDKTCWLPDFDSFDDVSFPPAVPPGVTPVSSDCPADGKKTGPLQFADSHDSADLLPSKWCRARRDGCSGGGLVGEGNYDIKSP